MTSPSKKSKYNPVPKAINFLTFGFDSIWRNFNPIWYSKHGFNPLKIGILRSILIIGIFFGPMWSIIADKTRNRKLVLSSILLCCLIILKLLNSCPYFSDSKNKIIAMTFLYTIFWVGIRPINDGMILAYLGEDKKLFGRQTMFSALGWLITCVLSGYLYNWYGFNACWNLMFLCVVGNLYLINRFIPNDDAKSLKMFEETPFFERLCDVLSCLYQVRVLKILFVLVIQGAGSNMIQSFLFVYLNDELKAPEYVCGWTIFFTCLFELPIFFYAHVLLEKLGINVLFIIAQSAFIIRTFLYTLLTEDNILWVLPIELLHGLTFALMWTSSTEFASEFCAKGLESVCMLILFFCFNYLGAFLGNLFGGLIYLYFGALKMFHFFGYCSLITLILFCYVCYLEYAYPEKFEIKKNVEEKKVELLENN